MHIFNLKDALLDRVELFNFWVTEIRDFDWLQKQGVLVVKEDAPPYIWYKDRKYSSIAIRNGRYFHEFIYGINKEGVGYARIKMLAQGDGDSHNLNCSSPSRVRQQIRDVYRELLMDYGIRINVSEIQYASMEINKTIELNYDFAEYHRVFIMMMKLFPPMLRLKDIAAHQGKNEPTYSALEYKNRWETYSMNSGERGIGIKMYDKRKELKDKYDDDIDNSCFRFEITLKSSTKIKSIFGTTKVNEISQKDINFYFSEFVEKNIEREFTKYKAKREIAMRKIIRKNYTPGSRTFVRATLMEILDLEVANGGLPIVLDIEELLAQVPAVRFKTDEAMNHALKKFREVALIDAVSLCQHDDVKYMELIQKLK